MRIADETPFEIPDSWEWVKLSTITNELTLNDGNWVLSSDMSDMGEVKLIQLGSIGNGEYIEKGFKQVSEKRFYELNGKRIFSGYLLVNRLIGDRMLCCIVPPKDDFLMTAVDVCWIAPQPDKYNIEYLMYVLLSGFFQESVKLLGRGTTRFRISKGNLINIRFPFPPLDEQTRIVAEIKKYLPLIAEYEKKQSLLNELNSCFPDTLRKSILQMAVQGKLVPQDPTDEPASVLLERIRAEKERMIKEGKIKRDKNESVIFRRDNSHYEKLGAEECCIDDEIPFEIPYNWSWTRLKNIVNPVSARRVHQSDWKPDGIPFFRAREIAKLSENGFVNNELFISKELYEEYAKSGIPKAGDIMVTAVGTLGKAYIVKESDLFYYKDASVICLENYSRTNPEYLGFLFQTPYFENLIKQNSAGTTVGTITLISAREYLIPLPPLVEQKRIVDKIKHILPYCERL